MAASSFTQSEERSFLAACGLNSDLGKVKKMVILHPTIARARDRGGHTGFLLACSRGNFDIVEYLGVNSALRKSKNNDGFTGFHLACTHGRFDIVKYLLGSTALHLKTNNGYTGFHLSCCGGNFEIVKYLLGVDPTLLHLTDTGGHTGFLLACSRGNFKIVKYLLGVDSTLLNSKNNDGFTGFHLACAHGQFDIVKYLLGFTVLHLKTNNGDTGFHLACCGGNFEIVKYLLGENSIVLLLKADDGSTGFHRACGNGKLEIVKYILGVGPTVLLLKDDNGSTGFHRACDNGKLEIVKYILGVDPTVLLLKDDFGRTGLHLACEKDKFDVANYLIKEDPTVLFKDNIDAVLQSAKSEEFVFLVQEKKKANFLKAVKHNNHEVARNLMNDLMKGGGLHVSEEELVLLSHLSLPINELLYLSEDQNVTSVILNHLLPNSPNHDEIVKLFSAQSFSMPKISLSSPLLTHQVVDLFPWGCMSNTLTHLQLANCALYDLPSGFAKLDENKIQRIDLNGNPLSGGTKAILQGTPRDVVSFVKEIVQKGEQKLMEVKVLVVGDAAVGKTTLLRSLKEEGRGDGVGKTSSTDGIEIGELFLGGMYLSCWDFAGQELYHYTHQFFLSDDAIYLMVFNLSEPFTSSISVQLTFWLSSIAQQGSSSQVLLIGTHASKVSVSHQKKKIRQVKNLVFQKFRAVVSPSKLGLLSQKVLVVDSVSGEGKEQVRKALSNLAQQKVQKVPVGFWGIRQMLSAYQNTLRSSSQPPVIQLKQLETILQAHPEEYPLMQDVATKSWELALKILHSLGSIVLVDCWGKEGLKSADKAGSVGGGGKKKKEEKEGEGAGGQEDHHRSDSGHSSTTFVILQPSWLADIFKTVVTFAPNFVKDGVVTIENLKNRCWSGYPDSMHELLLIVLVQFNVAHQLSAGKGGKVIVPCLLPDCPPSNLGCLVQKDQQEALSLLLTNLEKQKKVAPPLSPSITVSPLQLLPKYSPLRRSFLLGKQNEQLPVGVMGKMLSSLLQWGKIHRVWKTGCIVIIDHLVVVVWEGWCGNHLGVHFVLFTGKRGGEGGEGEEVNRQQPSLQGEMSFSSCSSSFSPSFSLPPAKTIHYLHQATQMMENLLRDYHNVDYKIITPCSVDQKGTPYEWVELKDVFLALQCNKSTVRTILVGGGSGRDRRRREVGVEGWLAPDYLLERVSSIDFYDENEILTGKLLGKGSYGEVHLAEVREMGCGGGKKKAVAAKKIILVEENLGEKKLEDVLKELYQETYFSLKVQHPNIVGLVGMCKETKPPLLLLELLDGDLFCSLMDPLGLKGVFNNFCKLVDLVASTETSLKKWEDVLTSPSENCTKLCDTLNKFQEKVSSFPKLKAQANQCLSQGKKYFEIRDKTNGVLWMELQLKFLECYEQLLNQIAPLSVVGVLRIAADISRGLHYLHSLTPPLIHRDLKGPNIFLTCSLAKGSGMPEYASKNVVAKLGDFGLSSMLCGPYQLRAQGRIANINPRWTAPEILEGRKYSIESDIYSMGLVLWETCYRKLAFCEIQGPFVDDKIKVKVIEGLRPSLSGKAIDGIIQKCWSKVPKYRPSAQAVYTSIYSLSSSIASELFSQLPPIVSPQTNNNKDQIETTRYCLRQQVKLPDNEYGSHSHRVSCLAVCGDYLWGGCQSGILFCYGRKSEKSAASATQEGEKDSRGGTFVDICHLSQLPHKATEPSRVNAIIGTEKEGFVWVGFENGWLSLWQGVGGVFGEELFFSSCLVRVRERRKGRLRNFQADFQSSVERRLFVLGLTLRHGELSWGEERSLSMKKVCQVRKRIDEGRKSGGFVFWLLGEREEPISPDFEVDSEEIWNKWVSLLEFVAFCFKRKRVLKRIGKVALQCGAMGGVLSLSMIDGKVWSIDGSLKITEWVAKPDPSGLRKGTYILSSLRSLNLSTHHPRLSKKFVFYFFSVGDKEIWVVCGKTVCVLERTSILEEAQKEGGKDEGTLAMGREWELFGEEGGEREEVWCGVYCAFMKDVWVGTSEGNVWRKGLKSGLVERKKVGGGGVRTMAIVGNQIWCGTMSGAIHRFGRFSFSSLFEPNNNKKEEEGGKGKEKEEQEEESGKEKEKEEQEEESGKGKEKEEEEEEEKGANNPHTHTISSILVQSSGENLKVWVGSYDKSFSLWKERKGRQKQVIQ